MMNLLYFMLLIASAIFGLNAARTTKSERPATVVCNFIQNVQFITNGLMTNRREFPYMVALGWETRQKGVFDFKCGGVLIDPIYVLTAAHCTFFQGSEPVVVKVGGGSLIDDLFSTIRISRIITHPDYKPTQSYNDIALIQIGDSVSQFDTACLWTDFKPAKKNLTAIGYGHTKFAGAPSEQLLKAYLNVIPNSECREYYEEDLDLPNGILNSQICAKDFHESGMDTCQGDSGTPLVMDLKKRLPYVVGITSFGQGCGLSTPGVYTRVSEYADWIEPIVWPNVN